MSVLVIAETHHGCRQAGHPDHVGAAAKLEGDLHVLVIGAVRLPKRRRVSPA